MVVCVEGVVSTESGNMIALDFGYGEIRVNRRCLRRRACEFPGVLVVCPMVKCH